MVFYRTSTQGKELLKGYSIRGMLKMESFTGLRPDDVALYTDFDFEYLGDNERKRVEELLYDLVGPYRELTGLLETAWIRRRISMLYPGRLDEVWRSFELEMLFLSLERRFQRSGIVGSLDEEKTVIMEETRCLGMFGKTHSDLEGDSYRWVGLNKMLLDRPLTLDGREKLRVLGRLFEKTGLWMSFRGRG